MNVRICVIIEICKSVFTVCETHRWFGFLLTSADKFTVYLRNSGGTAEVFVLGQSWLSKYLWFWFSFVSSLFVSVVLLVATWIILSYSFIARFETNTRWPTCMHAYEFKLINYGIPNFELGNTALGSTSGWVRWYNFHPLILQDGSW